MADNDQYNDEYQFTDVDPTETGLFDETEGHESPESSKSTGINAPTDVKRNALIVIVFVIVAMILYKFLGSYFSTQKPTVKPEIKKVERQPVKPIVVTTPEKLAAPKQRPMSTISSSEVSQKLSTIEVTQQTLRADVDTFGNQLTGVSSNVSDVAGQIERLNRMVASLLDKVESQSHDIDRLLARTKPRRVKRPVAKIKRKRLTYSVQALIPGRAWLIASNGSTITVREGSSVPGYGKVKLIDPNQGRVLTSSGRVIRFNQTDS